MTCFDIVGVAVKNMLICVGLVSDSQHGRDHHDFESATPLLLNLEAASCIVTSKMPQKILCPTTHQAVDLLEVGGLLAGPHLQVMATPKTIL